MRRVTGAFGHLSSGFVILMVVDSQRIVRLQFESVCLQSLSRHQDIEIDCSASGTLLQTVISSLVWFDVLLKGTCGGQGANQQPLQEQSHYHLCHSGPQISYDQHSRPQRCTCTRRHCRGIQMKSWSSLIGALNHILFEIWVRRG